MTLPKKSAMPLPELSRMTWRDAKTALARARVAIVPVGSTEQHGPHMTLDTDSAIAEAFGRRLGDALGEDAILCPTIRLGMSEHHLAFAGSLTLRAPTLMSLIEDVIESLGHHGLRRVLLVNGHGGNQDALRIAARTAARDKTSEVAAVMWAILAADLIAERAATAFHSHACDIETSVALAIAPEVVLWDRVEPPSPPSPHVLAVPGARYDIPVPFEHWTENGAIGDPGRATKELGDEIVALALERATEFARRFIGRT
jgi:creatinine amidohydrolase